MRILFVTPSYPPYFTGGGPTMAKMLVEELDRRGHKVTILTGNPNIKGQMYFKISRNIDMICIPYIMSNFVGKLNSSLIEYLPPSSSIINILRKILRMERLDIIHIFAFPLHAITDIAVLVSDFDNVVLTTHGIPTFYNITHQNLRSILRFLYKIYIKTIGGKVLSKVKVITTVSRYVAKQILQSCFPQAEIRVIPNAIDYGYYEKIRNEKIPRDNFDVTIISIGRIVPVKGYEYAIKAIYTLRELYKAKNVKYYIVGPIGCLKYYLNLQRLVKALDLRESVIFLGPISDRNKLAKLILSADIYLSPSLHETFGISVLEAMALGKPVIATDVPGHKELIKQYYSGILVPARDHKTIANAIIEVLQDQSLYRKISRNAIQEAKKYDIKVIASLYESTYKSLIN